MWVLRCSILLGNSFPGRFSRLIMFCVQINRKAIFTLFLLVRIKYPMACFQILHELIRMIRLNKKATYFLNQT